MKRQLRATGAAVLLISASALTACSGQASTGGDRSEQTFTIGVASSQTGYLAPFDTAILAGVQHKVDELNADGGLGGEYPIEVLVEDTRSDIATQATATQQLISSGAQALVLSCDSDPSIAGGQVAQRDQVIAFGCPSNPKQVGEFLFQMYVPERVNPTVMAQFATDQGWDTAFTVGSSDTAYTQNGVEYFASAYEKFGGSVVESGSFTLDQQDYSTLVAKIKAANPDVIWTMMYEPNIISFLNQLRGAGVTAPVLGDSLETPGVQSLSPEVRADVYYSAIADTNPGTPTGDYLAEISEEFGPDSGNVYALLGNDIVAALDAAVRETGSIDPSEIAAAISDLEFDGQAGTVSYDWTGSDNTQLREIYVKSPLGGVESAVLWSITPDPADLPPVLGQ